MDNLCHTLVGLAVGGAGMARLSRRGTLTLAIGANLPDVDALLYLQGGGLAALAGRRGWTHGVLALVLLPVALALLVAWWDAGARRRLARRGRSQGPPVQLGGLLACATAGVWSHALFDWLNSYGVRLLMPLDRRWFYGDALFIIDPWVWLALAVGVGLSWRRRRRNAPAAGRPARVALAAVAAYVVVAIVGSAAARALVERQVQDAGGPPARRVMAGPVALTPFRRDVVRDLGDAYELGTFDWLPRPRYAAGARLPGNAALPAAAAAARTAEGRAFLSWSRFPLFTVDATRPTRVRLDDARYVAGPRGGWASVTVETGGP